MAEGRRHNDFLCFLLKITKIRSRELHKVPLFSAAPSWGIYFANILLSPTPDTSDGLWRLSPSYSNPQKEKRSCGSLPCIAIECLFLSAWEQQGVRPRGEDNLVPNT